MAIEGVEILVYVLTAAQAMGVGFVFAIASGSRHRSALRGAGLLLVGVAVVAGFMVGASAPWTGPIFAIVASGTAILTAAASLGTDPAMRGQSFRQRVVFALSRRPRSGELHEN